LFNLPPGAAEPRYVSLNERDRQGMQIVLRYFRTRKVAVMKVRSEEEVREPMSQDRTAGWISSINSDAMRAATRSSSYERS